MHEESLSNHDRDQRERERHGRGGGKVEHRVVVQLARGRHAKIARRGCNDAVPRASGEEEDEEEEEEEGEETEEEEEGEEDPSALGTASVHPRGR